MEKIKKYLLNDLDKLKSVIMELNCYNGCLDSLDVHDNDEYFFDTHFEDEPAKAVRASYFGDYNYTHAYVTFDGYGNLKSYDDYDYEDLIKSSINEVLDNLVQYANDISLDDDLQVMVDDYLEHVEKWG